MKNYTALSPLRRLAAGPLAILLAGVASVSAHTSAHSYDPAITETVDPAITETVRGAQHVSVDRPTSIAVNPSNDDAYVVSEANDLVTVIDGLSGKISTTINVPGGPVAIAIDSAAQLAYTTGSGRVVSVIDLVTNQVRDTVRIGQVSRAVAINTVTGILYVGTEGNRVFSIDAETLEVKDEVGLVGHNVDALAVDERSNKVYAGSSSSNPRLHVLDGSTNRPVASPGVSADALIVDVDSGKLYTDSGKVQILSTATNKITNTLPMSTYPRGGLALDAENKLLYKVTQDQGSDVVAVIDTATERVIDRLSFPDPVRLDSRSRLAVSSTTHTLFVTNPGQHRVEILSAFTAPANADDELRGP